MRKLFSCFRERDEEMIEGGIKYPCPYTDFSSSAKSENRFFLVKIPESEVYCVIETAEKVYEKVLEEIVDKVKQYMGKTEEQSLIDAYMRGIDLETRKETKRKILIIFDKDLFENVSGCWRRWCCHVHLPKNLQLLYEKKE